MIFYFSDDTDNIVISPPMAILLTAIILCVLGGWLLIHVLLRCKSSKNNRGNYFIDILIPMLYRCFLFI